MCSNAMIVGCAFMVVWFAWFLICWGAAHSGFAFVVLLVCECDVRIGVIAMVYAWRFVCDGLVCLVGLFGVIWFDTWFGGEFSWCQLIVFWMLDLRSDAGCFGVLVWWCLVSLLTNGWCLVFWFVCEFGFGLWWWFGGCGFGCFG